MVSPRQLRHVDHVGARELVLELGDGAFVERLLLLGGVILGVLRQVAVGARLRDLLDDARPLDLLAVLEFGLEHGVTRRGHRNFVNHFSVLRAARGTQIQTRAAVPFRPHRGN